MITSDDRKYLALALKEAQEGWDEGGVPIGAALVHDGKVLAVGRNRRVQNDSAILHADAQKLTPFELRPLCVERNTSRVV